MTRAIGFFGAAVLLLSSPAFADDPKCACGHDAAECQRTGCSCGAGVCPLHGGKGMGMGMGMKQGLHAAGLPAFDATSVITIKGSVTAVERMPHAQGPVGLHLRVRSGAETFFVALGPSPFIEPKLSFAENDQVEISGSRVTFNGGPALLATVVKKGEQVLELRTSDGTPLFRGMRVGMAPTAPDAKSR